MALTALERKILESARQEVRARKQKFICYAIKAARIYGEPAQEVRAARLRLTKYVMDCLGDYHSTLGSWLADRSDGRWMDDDLQREARIAWITWMLGEKVEFTPETRRLFYIHLNRENALHSYDSSGHKVA